MRKFDHFNLLGPIYDLIFHGNSKSKLFELLDLKPDHYLLDVGGGTGRVSSIFQKLTPHVIIIDAAFYMLKEALKKGITAVNAEAEGLPFCANSFDRIVMIDALHHVANQERTLEEMWRLLKPGGKLIIEEPDIRHWGVKLLAFFEKALLMRSHFLEPNYIAGMLDSTWTNNKTVINEKWTAWIIIQK